MSVYPLASKYCCVWKMFLLCHWWWRSNAMRPPSLLVDACGGRAWSRNQAVHTTRKAYSWKKKKKNQVGAESVISISKRVGGRSLSLEVTASKKVEKSLTRGNLLQRSQQTLQLLHCSVPQKFSQPAKTPQMRSNGEHQVAVGRTRCVVAPWQVWSAQQRCSH